MEFKHNHSFVVLNGACPIQVGKFRFNGPVNLHLVLLFHTLGFFSLKKKNYLSLFWFWIQYSIFVLKFQLIQIHNCIRFLLEYFDTNIKGENEPYHFFSSNFNMNSRLPIRMNMIGSDYFDYSSLNFVMSRVQTKNQQSIDFTSILS